MRTRGRIPGTTDATPYDSSGGVKGAGAPGRAYRPGIWLPPALPPPPGPGSISATPAGRGMSVLLGVESPGRPEPARRGLRLAAHVFGGLGVRPDDRRLGGVVFALAAPEELHVLRHHADLRARLVRLRVHPAGLTQRAHHQDLAALLQELLADLRQPPPGRDVEEGRRLRLLAVVLRVLVGRRYAEAAHGRAARRVLEL